MNSETKTRIAALLSEIRSLLNDESEPEPGRVEEFLDGNLFDSPGEKILLKEFRERFVSSLPADKRHAWTRPRICRMVRLHRRVEHGPQFRLYILDASCTPPAHIPAH